MTPTEILQLSKEDREALSEAIIKACVPGGQSCDPQQIADAIREYFKEGE